MIRVWDLFVRCAHWLLVAVIAAAWITGERDVNDVHEWLGYAALTIVGARLIWGFIGSAYARFRNFLYSPRATIDYARAMVRGTAPRHIGHNPLGGWMIVALLITIAATGVSGWLYTTDRFWGDEMMEEIHEFFAHALLFLIAFHVSGVVLSSLMHKENLIRAMFTGKKRET